MKNEIDPMTLLLNAYFRSDEQLGKCLGVSRQTARRKRLTPGLLTRDEMKLLNKVIPKERIRETI